MNPKHISFVFTPGFLICACLALTEGSLTSCTYSLQTLDGAPTGGSGGDGGLGGNGGSTCGVALTNCAGTCVDTTSNSAHCGACGAACTTGLVCINGQCMAENLVCTAGMTKPCYNGPAGTANLGTCREGISTCLPDETGYGPCIGAVLPMNDICGNNLDEDCNGSLADGVSCLTNDGLVVRYVLDEAPNGQGPTMVMDSAANPLHLTVDYGGDNNMSYTNAPTGRGLIWSAPGSSGTASAPIDGTKVYAALEGKTQGTIEVVAELQTVTPDASRIFTIGAGPESGRFSLTSNTTDRVQFRWLDTVVAGDWPLSFGNSGRCVMHVVLDTTQVDANNRVRLYVNGTLVKENNGVVPTENAPIVIGAGRALYLGNRNGFIRSFAGSLYYAALYERPLADMEITSHASYLNVNDDR